VQSLQPPDVPVVQAGLGLTGPQRFDQPARILLELRPGLGLVTVEPGLDLVQPVSQSWLSLPGDTISSRRSAWREEGVWLYLRGLQVTLSTSALS
jgi:hypothetical protein